MAIAWMLEARASETCAVRSVSCPRAFSGVADVGFGAATVGFSSTAGGVCCWGVGRFCGGWLVRRVLRLRCLGCL